MYLTSLHGCSTQHLNNICTCSCTVDAPVVFQFTQSQYTTEESAGVFPVAIELIEGNIVGFPITVIIQVVSRPMSGSGSGFFESKSGFASGSGSGMGSFLRKDHFASLLTFWWTSINWNT